MRLVDIHMQSHTLSGYLWPIAPSGQRFNMLNMIVLICLNSDSRPAHVFSMVIYQGTKRLFVELNSSIALLLEINQTLRPPAAGPNRNNIDTIKLLSYGKDFH